MKRTVAATVGPSSAMVAAAPPVQNVAPTGRCVVGHPIDAEDSPTTSAMTLQMSHTSANLNGERAIIISSAENGGIVPGQIIGQASDDAGRQVTIRLVGYEPRFALTAPAAALPRPSARS